MLLYAKINDIKGEISNITNLATTTDLTTVEHKIPHFSNSVKTFRNKRLCAVFR